MGGGGGVTTLWGRFVGITIMVYALFALKFEKSGRGLVEGGTVNESPTDLL